MAITGIDAYTQALLAQQQLAGQVQAGMGTRVGGARPETSEAVRGIGVESYSAQPFNWRDLSRFDGALTGSTPQTEIGKTSAAPAQSIFAKASGGTNEMPIAMQNNGVLDALNAIDARDIGLNSNKNGFEGQRYLNLMA